MVELERAQNPWMSTEQTQRVGIDGTDLSSPESTTMDRDGVEFSAAQPPSSSYNNTSDWQLGVAERALSAAGAAFLSAIIVNPLDVVKVRAFVSSSALFGFRRSERERKSKIKPALGKN